jgi:hypothetical protein
MTKKDQDQGARERAQKNYNVTESIIAKAEAKDAREFAANPFNTTIFLSRFRKASPKEKKKGTLMTFQ